jgi:hypothetical protein
MDEQPSIFVSYAHDDTDWLNELDPHLRGLEIHAKVERFDDRQLLGGDVWDAKVKGALDRANIVLLLVSAHFIGSRYIHRVELPIALKKREAEGCVVIPILLTECHRALLRIDDINYVPKDSRGKLRPLAEWHRKAQRATAITQIIKHIDSQIRRGLSKAERKKEEIVRPTGIPAPPALYAKPTFIPRYKFVGRQRELGWLREWVQTPEPVMIFEAIGGMGKSMLTWQWVQQYARDQRSDWAGTLWYSFYERGADMNDFCVTALAYMAGRSPEDFRGRRTADLMPDLFHHLRARPWLIVLDGLERILVGYNRYDAAQAQDDDVENDPDHAGRRHEACVRPADDNLLQQLCGASPAKILISSRLMPLSLRNVAGPLPGIRHFRLFGLAPEDAERMMRDVGVRGNGARMRGYLERQFGCHPLVVGAVAGLVLKSARASGDFDRWVDDPAGGAEVNLAALDLTQRRNHILKLAFDGLDPDAREVIARLALISNGIEWEVLQALNPRRPDPPEEVVEPERPDHEWDFEIFDLRDQIEEAKDAEERASFESALLKRKQQLDADYDEARRAYINYQAGFAAWRQSPELRAADLWLNDTLGDLETRGLLQWDRRVGQFDLHPVVRGFAVSSMSAEARGQSGQRIADYFSSRPHPPYENAVSLGDLDIGLHIVRALNLAGKPADAFKVLFGSLDDAILRLELYHDWLALLRPLFPGGWDQPPVGVEDRGKAATSASVALTELGRTREADALDEFSIQEDLKQGMSSSLVLGMQNLCVGTASLGRGHRILELAREVGEAIADHNEVFRCDLHRVEALAERGEIKAARTVWDELSSSGLGVSIEGRDQAQALGVEVNLLLREGKLTEDHIRSAVARAEELGQRRTVRLLWRLRGEWRQSVGEHKDAAAAFERAIEMGREIGLSDPWAEAGYGISLAHLQRRDQALAAGARAEGGPKVPRADIGPRVPRAALAELYLVLGDHAKAAEHARMSYPDSWGDGPPYSWHWELQRCRNVLAALGEPEPRLPPFDPSKAKPLSFEADIRRLLEEHAAEKNP